MVLPITGIALILAFASLAAASVPLVIGLLTVTVTLALLFVLGSAFGVFLNSFAQTVATMVGLAVGIDYALLVVSRYRKALEHDSDRVRAAIATGATAGRTVAVSGVAVAVSLGALTANTATALGAPAVPVAPRPHRRTACSTPPGTSQAVDSVDVAGPSDSDKPSAHARLLEAAKRAFAQRGYHGTRVSDIVQATGLAQGTFYLHVTGKDDAFRQPIEGFFEALLDDALGESPPAATHSPSGVAAQVRAVRRGALLRYHEDRTLARLILREARCFNPAFADLMQQHYQRAADALVAYRRHPAVAPYLTDVDLDVAAWAILGMFESVACQKIVLEARRDIDDLADRLLELELYGLVRRDRRAQPP